MFRYFLAALLVLLAVSIALAQEKQSAFDFNKDRFVAGSSLVQDTEGIDDLFMVGETIQSNQDISGNAHFVARRIVSSGAIGGDAYLSGMEISVLGPVTGDITAAGYKVEIGETVGDIRATGANLELSGPVSGYALLSGKSVTIDSVVEGDVSLMAEEISFADDARIEGKLILYEEETGETTIPAQVISSDRIERRKTSDWSGAGLDDDKDGLGSRLFKFFKRVLFYSVLAIGIAAVRPRKLSDLRHDILAKPFPNLLFGFVAVSTGLGAAIVLLLTGVGFGLALVSVLMTFLAVLFGCVIGTYAIGVKSMEIAGRPIPDSLRNRTMAAVAGAVIVSIVAFIPFLGRITIMIIALIGAGAMAKRLFRLKPILGASEG